MFLVRTELSDESCGWILSCCQSVHGCWLSCNSRVEVPKSGQWPAFLLTGAAHKGFSQKPLNKKKLAFGWFILWSFCSCFFLLLFFFLPFHAFEFLPLSSYNTAILWCFQEFGFRFPQGSQNPMTKHILVSSACTAGCMAHSINTCECCQLAVVLYCLMKDDKTGLDMFGPVTVWFFCIFTTHNWLDLQIWNWQMGRLAIVI